MLAGESYALKGVRDRHRISSTGHQNGVMEGNRGTCSPHTTPRSTRLKPRAEVQHPVRRKLETATCKDTALLCIVKHKEHLQHSQIALLQVQT